MAFATLFFGCAKNPMPVCPEGTRTAGGRPPEYRAAWCEKPGRLRHGPIVGFTDGGRRHWEGGYDDGLYDGHFVFYGKKGDPIGAFDITKGTGPWKMWHENGRIAQQGEYRDGKKHGAWTSFHANGKRAVTGSYVDGLEEGLFQWWSDKGVLTSEATYERGRYHGLVKTFDAQGTRLEESEYSHGKRVRLTRWDEESGPSSVTFDLPATRRGPAITKSHPAVPPEWQRCSADHECELVPIGCCACGAADFVAVSYVDAQRARRALKTTVSCGKAECPTARCNTAYTRCDDSRCVTVE